VPPDYYLTERESEVEVEEFKGSQRGKREGRLDEHLISVQRKKPERKIC